MYVIRREKINDVNRIIIKNYYYKSDAADATPWTAEESRYNEVLCSSEFCRFLQDPLVPF